MTLETIRYSRGSLQILDQLLLPQQSRYEAVGSVRQAWEAIRAMKVVSRGGAQVGVGVVPLTAVPLTPPIPPPGARRPSHCPRGLPQPRRGAAGGRRGTWPCCTLGLRPGRAELPCHRPAHRRQHGPGRPGPGRPRGPGGGAGGRNGGGGPREVEEPCARHCSNPRLFVRSLVAVVHSCYFYSWGN